MKKTLLLLCSFLLIGGVSIAQEQDPKAKVILDKMSEKSKTFNTVYAEFSYNLKNKETGINTTQTGKVWVKDKKYHINLDDKIVVINDGRAMYTLDLEGQSGVINNLPDPDEMGVDPSNLFNIHNENFKYKLVSDDGTTAVIDLFPKNPKDVNFSSVRISVNKADHNLKKFVVKGRDGSVYTYDIKKFTPNVTIGEAKLRMKRSDWPQIEDWTDLREDE